MRSFPAILFLNQVFYVAYASLESVCDSLQLPGLDAQAASSRHCIRSFTGYGLFWGIRQTAGRMVDEFGVSMNLDLQFLEFLHETWVRFGLR